MVIIWPTAVLLATISYATTQPFTFTNVIDQYHIGSTYDIGYQYTDSRSVPITLTICTGPLTSPTCNWTLSNSIRGGTYTWHVPLNRTLYGTRYRFRATEPNLSAFSSFFAIVPPCNATAEHNTCDNGDTALDTVGKRAGLGVGLAVVVILLVMLAYTLYKRPECLCLGRMKGRRRVREDVEYDGDMMEATASRAGGMVVMKSKQGTRLVPENDLVDKDGKVEHVDEADVVGKETDDEHAEAKDEGANAPYIDGVDRNHESNKIEEKERV